MDGNKDKAANYLIIFFFLSQACATVTAYTFDWSRHLRKTSSPNYKTKLVVCQLPSKMTHIF